MKEFKLRLREFQKLGATLCYVINYSLLSLASLETRHVILSSIPVALKTVMATVWRGGAANCLSFRWIFSSVSHSLTRIPVKTIVEGLQVLDMENTNGTCWEPYRGKRSVNEHYMSIFLLIDIDAWKDISCQLSAGHYRWHTWQYFKFPFKPWGSVGKVTFPGRLGLDLHTSISGRSLMESKVPMTLSDTMSSL